VVTVPGIKQKKRFLKRLKNCDLYIFKKKKNY
jgi:hypothetical protein